MSRIDGLRARLRLLRSRATSDARFSDEIQFHIDMETDRLQRELRLDRVEARRRALVAFGGVEHHKEALRDGRGLRWLGGLSLDLKLGLRMLAKWPGLTLVGVLGMAVAVTIGTVSYGVIYTFIGSDVPLDEGHRVVMIENRDLRRNRAAAETHLHDMGTWRASVPALDELGAYRLTERNLIVQGARPEPAAIAEMTASGFRIARVAPVMGRYLLDEDERPGAPPVAVIGHTVWRERFGAASDIVGRVLQIGATRHVVVGVMPPGFAFPVNNQVWTPLRLDPLAFDAGSAPAVSTFGRLAPEASLRDAELQLSAAADRLAASRPEPLRDVRTGVLPYGLSFAENPGMAWAMHLVQLAMSLLLVVIGINVATLVYARTAGRMGEIAVRTALGASRARIVAQLFAEAFVLSCIGSAIGLSAAVFVLRYLQSYSLRLGGDRFPYWWDFGHVSPGMVLYVFGLSLLAAFVVGAVPALKATGRGIRANLQQLGAGSGGMRLGRSWTVLIVAQVTVAVFILPVVVHLVLRSNDGPARPPFATGQWTTASVLLDRATESRTEADDRAFAGRYGALSTELVRRLRADATVSDVVVLSGVPGNEPGMRVEPDRMGRPADDGRSVSETTQLSGALRVDGDFFDAFDIPVLTGRALAHVDAAAAGNVVVVNQPFVRRVLGDGNPLGRRVRAVADEPGPDGTHPPVGPWYEVVGVVPDFPGTDGSRDRHPVMYQPLSAAGESRLTIAVRVRGGTPVSATGRLREIAVAVDPMLRLDAVRPMDETQSMEAVMDRVILWAVLLVTASVVLLSAAGIYALMSFTIARRRREIGVRAALGAGARQIVTGVLSRAAGQVGLGITLGTALACVAIQGIEGWTWEPRNLASLLGVSVVMAVVGIAAAWGPAREALRIQPTEALRAD